MHTELIATTADCPADDCPALQRDPVSGDIYVQGYALTGEQLTSTDATGGPLPAAEGRLRIPGAVFDSLVDQHRGR